MCSLPFSDGRDPNMSNNEHWTCYNNCALNFEMYLQIWCHPKILERSTVKLKC